MKVDQGSVASIASETSGHGRFWIEKLSVLLEEGRFDAVQKPVGVAGFRQAGNQPGVVGTDGRCRVRVGRDE
ncbi:hypothetical protein D3C85_1796890 [compost metagenome]